MASLDSAPPTSDLHATLLNITLHRDKYVSLMRKLFKLELRMDPTCVNPVLKNRIDEAYARFSADLHEFGVSEDSEFEGENLYNELTRAVTKSVHEV